MQSACCLTMHRGISSGFFSIRFATSLLTVALIFVAGMLHAGEPTKPASFAGPFYFRLPGFRSFVLQHDFSGVPLDTLVAVRPDVHNPLATDARMLVGSYTVTMLPGASLKLTARGFVPLAGRFIFSGEGDEPLVFASRAYELYYNSGRLLLEVTPDDGTFIALRNKGDAFVKALNRQIFDLAAGQEVYFPLFGEAKLKKRLSGFWSDPPTGFSAARRRLDSTSSAEEDAEEAEEDAEQTDRTEVTQDSEDTGSGDDEKDLDATQEEVAETADATVEDDVADSVGGAALEQKTSTDTTDIDKDPVEHNPMPKNIEADEDI